MILVAKTYFRFTMDGSNGYEFCQICLELGAHTIGDFEQRVVAGTLKLSLDELLVKLERNPIIICEYQKLAHLLEQKRFSFPEYSVLPVGIESFDGDFAMFVSINMEDYLVFKAYDRARHSIIRMKKEDYIQQVKQVLIQLNR